MSDVKVFTGSDVLAALKQAVEEFGPDTTRQCTYVEREVTDEDYENERNWAQVGEREPNNWVNYAASPNGTGDPVRPHCIAGVVLHGFGMSLDTLVEYEAMSVAGIKLDARGTARFPTTDGKGIPQIDDEGWAYLNDAQIEQDSGSNWGTALERAESEHIRRVNWDTARYDGFEI